MGQCITNTPRQRHSTYRYCESLATETPSFKELHTLAFHADIANVGLKKYPYRSAKPVFRFRPGHHIVLEARETDKLSTLKWKTTYKCDFGMSEHELRQSCLQVEVYNESNRPVGALSVNLFLIATGPFHQDFAIQFENGVVGRITFDLRVSQVIELSVQSLTAEVELLRDHPGQEFNFSIQTIAPLPVVQGMLSGETSRSCHSYSASVLLQKKFLEISHQSNEKETLQNEVKVSGKEVETGKVIAWSQQKGQLPSLSTKVLASQLHNTYFQILIWKQSDSSNKQTFQFFADTYVSFYKLFATEAQRIVGSGRERECRIISITEKIQHYGKDYGKGHFTFRITNEPYFKQYQICVHTEHGILKTAPIFAEEAPKEMCSQLKELQSTSEKIEQSVIKLSGCESKHSSSEQLRKIKGEIEINLEKIFHLLEQTSYPPAFLYRYGSEEALLRGQKVLVTVGAKAAEYLQLEDPVINDICWLILISLAKRAEFSLSHMGFHEPEKQLLKAGNINAHLKEKLKLVAVYRTFTCRMLELALNALNRKGSEYESTFAEVYCACAYFKVPQFRKELLALLWRPEDPEIEQWRGMDFSLREQVAQGSTRKGNIFGQLFDWQQECYSWIGEEGQAHQALREHGWRQRFHQRGQEFFYFIKYWVTYVESQLPPNKQIQWRYFPGYNRLLLALFAQMKRIPVLEYPDALLQCCTKLLANEKLVNPMVAIVLNQINAFDITAVLKGVDFLSQVFLSFSAKKRPLPMSFNYSFFYKAIKVILDGESSLQITSLLTLLYTHFALFHSDFRRSLSMYLLGNIFWKLFLHWSHTVRYCFHHLITYRIYGNAYEVKKSTTQYQPLISEGDIIERYKLATKLASQYEQQPLNGSRGEGDFINDQHYYKRMRMKVFLKMRKQEQGSSLGNLTKEDYSNKEITSAHTFSLQHAPASLKTIQLFRRERLSSFQKEYHSEYEPISQASDFKRTRDDSSPLKIATNSILFQKVIPEEDMQLQEIGGSLRRRLSMCLSQFRAVEKGFILWVDRQGVTCPPLSYQFDIDNRQIRPKEMENW